MSVMQLPSLPASYLCNNILVHKHQNARFDMSRLTITISDLRYRALKEASAQRDKTIGQLIEESLEFYGIKSREDARALVQRARRHSGLSEARAMSLATKEVKLARKR